MDKVNGKAIALSLISIYLISAENRIARRLEYTLQYLFNREESSTRCSFTIIFILV